MKKVVIENSVNVDVMIEKMEDEFGYWNENYDFDFVKNYVLENGNGIYEFSFGEMGLGEIRKNDEYFSLEEMVENDLVRKNNKFSREECIGYYNNLLPIISQNLNTIAGNTYTLSYYLYNPPENNGQNIQFVALINNIDVSGSYISLNNSFDWTLYEFTFIATSSASTLQFNSIVSYYLSSYLFLGNISVVDITPPMPISTICFPAHTPILTDQGLIDINKINPKVNTINSNKIIAITKTISCEDNLVCFEKDSLGLNYPNKRTIMTNDHKILFKGKMIEAKCFLDCFKTHNGNLKNSFNSIIPVKYNGEILYNVLMKDHNTMNVNNLIVETLNPNHIIAQLYTKNDDLRIKYNIICNINRIALQKKQPFKKILGRLF
jgi:hypothetical protein